MHTVTSFHGGGVAREELGAVMNDYFALERARTCRRLFVTRFGLLATVLAVIGFGLHWLTQAGSWVSMGLCAIAPAWAWVTELRCDWRLTRRLNALPHSSTHVVAPPRAQKVIKSS